VELNLNGELNRLGRLLNSLGRLYREWKKIKKKTNSLGRLDRGVETHLNRALNSFWEDSRRERTNGNRKKWLKRSTNKLKQSTEQPEKCTSKF
jgi:hypothetical protein